MKTKILIGLLCVLAIYAQVQSNINTTAALIGSSLIGAGTHPTISFGAGTGSIAGTQLAGVVTSTTTGTITFTLTFPIAYPTRPVCSFRDETTTADIVGTTQSTAPTTTTITATGTTASGDVISYSCSGY